MRHFPRPKTTQLFWDGIALPAKLGLGILLLGLAGPALGGREAPAVWVPLAPAGMEIPALARQADAKQPMVPVPFQGTLYVPHAGQPLVPWTPEYLAAPGPGSLDGAARRGLLPRNARRAETGPPAGQGNARTFTLSDVLRDVAWRRQTAKRLSQDPAFKPRF